MAARNEVPHLSIDQRQARGQQARDRAPPSSHTGWEPAADRPDPVALLEEQDATREPDLVPVRHGRMLVSPFTFYRGAAKIMAADLKGTPTAGLRVQLCGDAHLSNFGFFASPERRLLVDLNDFDETLPGPFEYDVKRMAASFTIAGRHNGFGKADTRAVTRASVREYRQAMAGFAAMGTMGVWYARLDEELLLQAVRAEAKGAKKAAKRVERARKTFAKARTRDSLQALSKLGELVDGRYRIVSQPPIVVPARDLQAEHGLSRDEVERGIREHFRAYRATLRSDHRQLLERFEILDVARKVVDGQRMMQAASDIYLGWTRDRDAGTRHYYWRQLRDMKGSVEVESTNPAGLGLYARICGWTLARAHARSGDPIAIATYLGEDDEFDRSIADFAKRYADQNERDYQAFADAVGSGRLEAREGV